MHKRTEIVAAFTGPVDIQARWGPSTERENKHERFSSLTQKLAPIGKHLHRKNWISSMESHRACKSHVRVGPMPSNSRLTQNRLMTFFETLSFILLYYDNFFLTGLFLVCYRFWFFVFVNFMMVLFLLLFLWFCLFLKKIVWGFFLFQFIENRFFLS